MVGDGGTSGNGGSGGMAGSDGRAGGGGNAGSGGTGGMAGNGGTGGFDGTGGTGSGGSTGTGGTGGGDPLPRWHLDFDGDGFGDPSIFVEAEVPPIDYVDNGEDCYDLNRLAWNAAAPG